jgi:hypothetical protein
MAEMYVTALDAEIALRVSNPTRPSYLPDIPPQTVSQYRAALGKLGKLGIVKVH